MVFSNPIDLKKINPYKFKLKNWPKLPLSPTVSLVGGWYVGSENPTQLSGLPDLAEEVVKDVSMWQFGAPGHGHDVGVQVQRDLKDLTVVLARHGDGVPDKGIVGPRHGELEPFLKRVN